MQGSLLEARGAEGAAAFPHIAKRVKSGDTGNQEAQAARRYWPLLMGTDFRRDKAIEGVNALLNFGYAVIRATIARAVIAAGLHPTIGIHRADRGNAFALADDLVEPFRPLVDTGVAAMVGAGIKVLNPSIKRSFARPIAFDLPVGTKKQSREATRFREFLLDQGFGMSQFSIYARFCNGKDSYEPHLRRIERILPEKSRHSCAYLHRQAV